MGGGGKGGTTTQSVSIPPEVLARYNAVNARAENVAQQPFMAYPGQFVAPLTGTQQQGIAQTSQSAGLAQPYYGAAAGMTLAGSQGVGPLTQGQIAYYQNPFTQSVVNPTLQALQQQQGQERAQQQAQAIRAGAFGGDRAGIERANLARQQALGTAQAIAPLYAQGYQTGVQTAAGQQGVIASDLQRQLAAGQQLGGLGAGAQAAALQGAQAQIGAGTLEQQTQQADLTARYQQFLQERGFPYQQAQFLANIAMGTGALSGSTTTTTQPTSFFSDERMKENVHPIGETFDGQTIYKYNYRGEPGTQIGLIAQEVERKHPDAVGQVGGMKTVDYDRATEKAGGLGAAMASMGGAVHEPGAFARGGYAPGGLVDPNDIQAILASQRQSFGPFASGGPYGQATEQAPFSGAGGIVPTNRLPTPKLMTAGPAPRQQEGGLRQAMSDIAQGGKFAEKAGNLLDKFSPEEEGAAKGAESFGKKLAGFGKDVKDVFSLSHGGGIRPHYAQGGGKGINPYDMSQSSMDYFPEEVLESGEEKRELLKPGQAPSSGGGGGLGSAIGTASNLVSLGTAAAKAAPYLMAMLPFSDRRLKHDVEPIGKTYDGQNIYRYHMGDGAMRMGLMAQEVAEHNPDAVARGPGGYLMLDYDKATQEAVPYEGGVRPRDGYQRGGPPEMSDEDYAIRTIASEMSGKSPEEARGIAAVIENRLRSGRFGSTYKDIVTAPKQFEPWSDPTLKNYPLRYTPGSPRYEMARAAFEQRGDDPTGGAMHFWAPAAQAKLERQPPSWDREGTMIGATKFVPGVNVGAGVRPSGGMPEAPRDAAPRAEGVKPSSGFFGGPPIEFASKTAQDPKGKPFESYKDFFTSRQFLIPFGAGLAGMAASPSRYLGSAILQGVGTGLGAYGAMEEQQAKVQEAVARKGLTEAQTSVQRAIENETDARAAGASIVDIQGVPHILVRDRRTGEERYVNFNIDYKRNRDAYDLVIKRGQQGGLGGAGPTVGAAPAVGGGRSDTIPAPGIKPIGVETRELPPPPGAETAPPVAPAGGVKPPMPMASNPFALTDPVIERAQREAADRPNLPTTTIEKLPDLLVDQSKIANVAEALKPTFVQIGVLGSTPRVGFTSQGPLQPLTTEIASLANDIVGRLRVFGGSRPFNQNDIADFEAWEKKLTELSSMAASAGDQTAVEALKRLRQMYPSASQSPPGFAKNLAELLVVNQKDIQKAKFLSDYTDIVKQQDPRMPGRVDPAVGRLFEDQYGGVFEKHREALEKMLRADNPAFLPRDERTKQLFLDDKGRPMSWFTYLQKYGDTLPPERVAQIERAFKAPGIMSYFRTGMGAQ